MLTMLMQLATLLGPVAGAIFGVGFIVELTVWKVVGAVLFGVLCGFPLVMCEILSSYSRQDPPILQFTMHAVLGSGFACGVACLFTWVLTLF